MSGPLVHATADCWHLQFQAEVSVGRVVNTPDGAIAEMTVTCLQCGTPFHFAGGTLVTKGGSTLVAPMVAQPEHDACGCDQCADRRLVAAAEVRLRPFGVD